MTEWTYFDRDGTRLALADLGGAGPAVLLLHGLAGHAEEWLDTATCLGGSYHVFALDLRGHGRSERHPDEVTRDALVEDAVCAIEQIGASVIIGGQSLGGLIALLVAASRPHLVRALVVVEASPEGMGVEQTSILAADVEKRLRGWPLPFRTEEEALHHFEGPSGAASAWVRGLEERQDGLWPRFEVDVLTRMIREVVFHSAWDEWESIDCPALVVRGEDGELSEIEAQRMQASAPHARVVAMEAGHDVHLDNPEGWRGVLTDFLGELP